MSTFAERELDLSAAQVEVWTAQELDPSSAQFICGGYIDIAGSLRPQLLESAIRQVVAECEALQLHLTPSEGEGSVKPTAILAQTQALLSVIDVSGHASPVDVALDWMKADLERPLMLSRDRLFLHVLFQVAQDRHLFYFRYHHLLLDGFGQVLYWRRLARVYSALAAGAAPPPTPFSGLADLAAEEAEYRASQQATKDRDYWLSAMASPPQQRGISAVATGLPGRENGAQVLRTNVSAGSPMRLLHKVAAGRQTHWAVVALAATAAYLQRLSRHSDIVLGLPTRARTTRTALTTPAMMSNELPLRLHLTAGTTVDELIGQVAARVSGLLTHQRHRGEELYRALRAGDGHAELPDVVVNLISFDGALDFAGSTGTVCQLSAGPVRDLAIDFYGGANDGSLRLGLSAVSVRHHAAGLAAHQARLLTFLQAMLAAPGDTPIGELELLTAREQAQLLTEFNATARPYDLSTSLPSMIAQQAGRTPAAVAVQTENERLSYAQLLDGADRLAAYLLSRGVRPGDVVGVHDVRSLEMVISLLAVLRAGAAYLPLDPELPASRLAFQIRDAEVRVVLTRSGMSAQLPDVDAIPVDTVRAGLPAVNLPDPGPTPDRAAYVIYTSGSTGQPKGVVVPHKGVVNRLLWMRDDYQFGQRDCVLQKTSFSFDVSVWEIFLPLITGGRLHLLAPGAQRDPRQVARAVSQHEVTFMHFVPSMLDLFLDEDGTADLPGLRYVFCSGEVLRPQTVAAFRDRFPAVALHNLYGPTEASVDVTAWHCRADDDYALVPIGRPVANTAIYILDPAGCLVPVGVPGELHIGGVQVASGYLNREQLTGQHFIANPFGQGTLYRTGDVARWRDDGAVEFLGRVDHQVKIRGYRVEPGEIEAALRSYPAVRQAVVIAYGDDSRRSLAGYVASSTALDTAELRGFLAERLPAYLIPASLIVLDELPSLSNGKLDRAALPRPDVTGTGSSGVPSTPGEYMLHQVWAKVLGHENFGTDESFFALGGDSMLAIRTRTELERVHDRTFTVAQLFEGPTIRELAARLRPAGSGTGTPAGRFGLVCAADRALLPEGIDDAYPLSSMQAGMLFHDAYQEESSVYRVVTSVRVIRRFDLGALRAACAATVARHPSLRCSFELTRYSEPLQLVHDAVSVPIEIGDTDEDLDHFVSQAKFTRFDPADPPLFKFVVHRRGQDGFQLTVIEHHVILDGWSDLLLLEEVLDRYRAALAGERLSLPAVATTYRDFVAAERRILADPAAREFWTRTLGGSVPTGLYGRSVKADSGPAASKIRRFGVPVPAQLADRLRTRAREQGLPLKSLLVAAHLMVLRTASGQEEVVTGLVANARLEQPGGDEVIGVFLNTLPLRMDLAAVTLAGLARGVFEYEQRVAPYRRYPFAQIQRDLGQSAPPDSYVNFMDFHRGRYRAQDAGLDVGAGVADTNYPLAVDFLVEPVQGDLSAWLDCDLSVLTERQCARLAGYYRRALEAVAVGGDRLVADVDLLADEEHAELAAWTATESGYDAKQTVAELIERQARSTPGATALAYQWDQCSYAELDARSNQLAHRLTEAGVCQGDRVGVNVRRGIDLVVALLGVLKTGAAYVPMDPAFPAARLAMIAADAEIACLVTDPGGGASLAAPAVVGVSDIAGRPATPVGVKVSGADVAYVMYTSGTTGVPKGVAVTHANAVNFCAGMDQRIGCGPQDVMLAVTSVSFDISVLELLWPLTRGAKVVVAGERIIQNLVRQQESPEHAIGFSLFFFAAAATQAAEGYRLVLDAARFADTHGFQAIWTPERHFHAFGGLYPNPSVMSAALATVTKQIGLRCGSVVAPLHDPVRMAEEWSLVDNLSGGRVGLAFASGWNSNDFVFFPERYQDRKREMTDCVEQFRTLWRGEPVQRAGGSGEQVQVRVFPRPVQAEPSLWLTSVGSLPTFRQAGASGVNLLTHLLGQAPDALAEKIAAYQQARQEAGHEGPGHVTVMVHTFMSDDPEQARKDARGPFRDYLRRSTELWRTLFATTGQEFPERDAESYLDAVIDKAIDRYFETSGLFGSPESCLGLVRTLAAAGVDEIACLIDFGPSADAVLDSLTWVDRLRRDHEDELAQRSHSLAELCKRHKVTLMQGTPSLLSAVAAEPEALAALRPARALLVGGESFPSGLARRLMTALPNVRVLNMYGPTETTIWSTVHELDRTKDAGAHLIPIGTPIANTVTRVVDSHGHDLPAGVVGELWIGGDGVAAGYLGKPELTAVRFVTDGAVRYYRTGDRVRWCGDGTLEFLGRTDRQVKVHGHRVEPDEVESVLSRHDSVDAVAVVATDGPSGAELIAYVSPAEVHADPRTQQVHVQRWTETWQETYSQSGSEFAGWQSSYTGKPIPAAVMREWLDRTVQRIAALKPSAMADVGVGYGLVLRSFAERTTQYHGLDISATALAAAADCLGPGRPLPDHVTLVKAGPEYLATLPADSLDTVVMNSVVQYFPGTDYLRAALAEALRVVRPGGAVFIGDVRSLQMLPELHTSVQLHRAQPLRTLGELRALVDLRVRDEPELCLSPAFFRQFAGEVRLELKRGRADSELSAFRYDVTVIAGSGLPGSARPGDDIEPASRFDFADLPQGIAGLLSSVPDKVLVTGIPNRRLVRPVAAVKALAAMPDEATVWDLERELWQLDETAAVHPEDLAELAGRPVRLLVPDSGRLDTFDAIFEGDTR